MLDSAMIQRLFEIHYTLKYTNKKISRKAIKVIVDSIIEQLCNHFFDIKPNGIQKIRALINSKINSFTEQEDKDILNAFDGILREYPSVFSKTYSDHDSNFGDFMNQEVRILSKALSNHSIFRSDVNAKKLRGLLV